jgi:hypothetical protein
MGMPDEDQGFSWRERAFIRAVVHHDYEAHKADGIYPVQALFMAKRPRERFNTLFDYSFGRLRFAVYSIDHQYPRIAGVEWPGVVSRVLASEGRMELHVVHWLEEELPRLWVVPPRTNSSGVYSAMCRIASSLPPGIARNDHQVHSPVLLEAVKTVLDEEKNFRAIH